LILVVFGIIMFAVGLVNYYNPVYTFIFGFGALDFQGTLNSIVSFLSLLTALFNSPLAVLKAFLIVVAILAVVSLTVSIGLAGIFNVINNEVEGKPKVKGQFYIGLKNYYFRTVFITFRVLFFSVFFLLFLMVSSIPAIILTQAWISNKPGLFALTLLVDIITLLVLFFCMLFFAIYMLFWFPASLNCDKKPFVVGKRTADAGFREIAGKFLLIGIVFMVCQYILLFLDGKIPVGGAGASVFSVLLFLTGWAVNAAFSSFLTTYVFLVFKWIRTNRQVA